MAKPEQINPGRLELSSNQEGTMEVESQSTSPHRWGDQDERGALNLLTPEKVLAATRLCRTGTVYPLAVPIRRDALVLAHRGAPQRYGLLNHTDEAMFQPWGAAPGVGANEDVLVLPSHGHTHMDALCHVYA